MFNVSLLLDDALNPATPLRNGTIKHKTPCCGAFTKHNVV